MGQLPAVVVAVGVVMTVASVLPGVEVTATGEVVVVVNVSLPEV